jgi:type III restriction enzyme
MTQRRDPFPLATGLSNRLDGQIRDLVAGLGPELLGQVTRRRLSC